MKLPRISMPVPTLPVESQQEITPSTDPRCAYPPPLLECGPCISGQKQCQLGRAGDFFMCPC